MANPILRNRVLVGCALGLIAGAFAVWCKAGRETNRQGRVGEVSGIVSSAKRRAIVRGINSATSVRGSISGTVRAVDKRPVPGATVCTQFWGEHLSSDDMRMPVCTMSDERGVYVLVRLFAGHHSVGAQKAGYMPARYSVPRSPPQSTSRQTPPTRWS